MPTWLLQARHQTLNGISNLQIDYSHISQLAKYDGLPNDKDALLDLMRSLSKGMNSMVGIQRFVHLVVEVRRIIVVLYER